MLRKLRVVDVQGILWTMYLMIFFKYMRNISYKTCEADLPYLKLKWYSPATYNINLMMKYHCVYHHQIITILAIIVMLYHLIITSLRSYIIIYIYIHIYIYIYIYIYISVAVMKYHLRMSLSTSCVWQSLLGTLFAWIHASDIKGWYYLVGTQYVGCVWLLLHAKYALLLSYFIK